MSETTSEQQQQDLATTENGQLESSSTRDATLCAGGHQYPLDWHSAKHRSALITNQPREMMMASGFIGAHAKWIGFCVRCGDSAEWSTDRPLRKERYRRKRDKHGAPMPPERAPVLAVDPSRSPPKTDRTNHGSVIASLPSPGKPE